MQLPSNKAVLVLLALIVTVSGCADNSNGSVTVSQTEGVSIQDFSAVPTQVFEGQTINLELQLKNNGGSHATDVVAKIYNVPFDSEGANRAWKINNGDNKVNFDNLRAPNPETDAPSISVPRTWSLTAPDLQQGVSIPYDFYTRVFYKYNTTGTTDVQIMSSQRYREEGASRTTPTIDNSGGPIQLDVKTRTPIIFFGDGGQRSELCVIVENAGTGTPFLPSAYKGGTDYQVNETNVDKVELSIETSGRVVSVVEGAAPKKVSIIGGRGVECFTLDFNSFENQQIQKTLPITLNAEYGYYKESSTSVTVKGRRG